MEILKLCDHDGDTLGLYDTTRESEIKIIGAVLQNTKDQKAMYERLGIMEHWIEPHTLSIYSYTLNSGNIYDKWCEIYVGADGFVHQSVWHANYIARQHASSLVVKKTKG